MINNSHVRRLIYLFALSIAVPAISAPIESVEEVIDSVASSTLRKLSNERTRDEALAEINTFFGRTIINKPAEITARVDFAGVSTEGRNDFRIRASADPVKWRGGEMERLTWFYFPESSAPAEAQVPVGTEIVVSGVVRRCEIVIVDGKLRINFDLVEAVVEKPAP